MATELDTAALIVVARTAVEAAGRRLRELREQKGELSEATQEVARAELALSELYHQGGRCSGTKRAAMARPNVKRAASRR